MGRHEQAKGGTREAGEEERNTKIRKRHQKENGVQLQDMNGPKMRCRVPLQTYKGENKKFRRLGSLGLSVMKQRSEVRGILRRRWLGDGQRAHEREYSIKGARTSAWKAVWCWGI